MYRTVSAVSLTKRYCSPSVTSHRPRRAVVLSSCRLLCCIYVGGQYGAKEAVMKWEARAGQEVGRISSWSRKDR